MSKILYVCEECEDRNEEVCGYWESRDLRLAPDGKQICNNCFDDSPREGHWRDLPPIDDPISQLTAMTAERDALAAHGVVMREALEKCLDVLADLDIVAGSETTFEQQNAVFVAGKKALTDQPPQVKAILRVISAAEAWASSDNSNRKVQNNLLDALDSLRIQGEDRHG